MARKPLHEKQLKVIEELVTGDKSITQICEECEVGRRTYYDWKRDNELFNQTLQEALDLKHKIAKQNIKSKTEHYIKLLERVAEKGQNENAKVNAIGKIISLGGLEDEDNDNGKKDESKSKNKLIEMLKAKKDKE
ncbi:phBC6A51 family helix-turn-helix protein [Bacillus sp. SM2101]|uniref:phBC6A51 family helix-turn-helix protein n=1 Tax=Bacillus sp. SM2101 TaxID=2805366 RepID=UPI001BDF37E1|nr:phBC6A51 family helix-turn-helix protein [Bacillus sp. SM2101]